MVKNTKKIKISVIILQGQVLDKTVFDKCLKSVVFAEEIIKVETSKINGGFSEWRNEGLKKAKGDWVFYVDTDEVVSNELKNEIISIAEDTINNSNAYAIPRRNFIFGKEFKHSGQYPDYQKRLFKRSALKKWTGNVHEEPVFEGKINHLINPIEHYKNMTISQMIEKTNRWSEIEADLMIGAKHPSMNVFRFASAASREFWKRFVIEKAFLDGKEGIIYGIYQIYSKLISYSKLWEKQQ